MNNLALEHWPIDRLIEYAHNPRRNDDVVERMCAAIREFGFRIPIVARSDGTVVDGHLRLKAARRLELPTVPVVLVDELSEAQIKAFRLLANRSANWAEWDDELLKLELEELQAAEFPLELTGFDTEDLDRLLETDGGASAEDDQVPEPPADAITRPGDLWICGEHRVLCGDARAMADVERVLGGELADMCFCDPPYNVNYANSAGDKRRGKSRPILNDALGSEFGALLYDACINILMLTKGAVYICMSSSELDTLQKAFREAGGKWSTFIIWAKNTFTLGRSDYQRQYEPILYGWRDGADHYWCGARDQGDVWFIDKPSKNDLHPTMKPVALVERAIRNSSRSRDIVLDLFGGSGTTMIAAEHAGRRARLIELDPKYVDVIVQRWQENTGNAAMLATTGETFDKTRSQQTASTFGVR
jgi:DNA modification methylase